MSTDRPVRKRPLIAEDLLAKTREQVVAWTSRDAILYALAVGAGRSDPQFSTDNSPGIVQVAIPSMATVLGGSLDRSLNDRFQSLEWPSAVEVEHTLELWQPLTVTGEVKNVTRVKGVYDTGQSALVVVESVSRKISTSETWFVNRSTILFRGQGGFGGASPPLKTSLAAPRRNADWTVSDRPSAIQAHIFRLTGDDNALHTSPEVAAQTGFESPILQGMCTLGFACRALVGTALGGDASVLNSATVRFLTPVYPEEELNTEIWAENDHIRFRVWAESREAVQGVARPRTAPSEYTRQVIRTHRVDTTP